MVEGDPRERLECLREMLRVMPKHKGTDHLQGDIKRRIKELSEELERPRKGGARGAEVRFHNNTVALLQPDGPGPVADFVADRGEGIMGASIHQGDPDRQIEMTVRQQRQPRPIRFYPREKAVRVPRYTLRTKSRIVENPYFKGG